MITEVYISPFQGLVSWLYHFIGRCPMLVYAALSGLSLFSPEGVFYSSEAASPLDANDGHSPSDKKENKKSPERA